MANPHGGPSRAALTRSQVGDVRRLRRSGVPVAEVAHAFGVSENTVRNAVRFQNPPVRDGERTDELARLRAAMARVERLSDSVPWLDRPRSLEAINGLARSFRPDQPEPEGGPDG